MNNHYEEVVCDECGTLICFGRPAHTPMYNSWNYPDGRLDLCSACIEKYTKLANDNWMKKPASDGFYLIRNPTELGLTRNVYVKSVNDDFNITFCQDTDFNQNNIMRMEWMKIK